jgi:hypothetical protein
MGFGVVFAVPKDKFHGEFILNGCYSIMISKIFQGKTKL